MSGGPYRRVVPLGYQVATVRLEGTSPYLMRPDELDPDSDEVKTFRMLSRKRGKTEEDEARLRKLEWTLSLAIDPKLGPYVPSRYLHKLIGQAATAWRKGEAVVRSLVVLDYRIALEYDGPRDPRRLWENGFRFSRLVVNNGQGKGAVYRTRPKFDEWVLRADVAFDPEELDPATIEAAVDRAQRFGLGDARRIGYGAFRASVVLDGKKGGGLNAKASTNGDPDERKAHRAKVKEVTRS